MKIIVIRRDNIGDLVCTTPLFRTLRRHYPEARIVALVNDYNAPVLERNTDIDEVFVYTKAKHRTAAETKLGVWWKTWALVRMLRREEFDLAIVATPARQREGIKFARWIKATRLIAYGARTDGIDDALDTDRLEGLHETEAVMQLLRPLGIEERPGPVTVVAPAPVADGVDPPEGEGPIVGLHISARKPPQRWPVTRFAEVAAQLHSTHSARFLVFWSPGAGDNPVHPGDDEKALQLKSLCIGLPLLLRPTRQLPDLIAGLSACDLLICSDGGAMHLAAGLGKPIVCLFGNSTASRWHPWNVPYELLQPDSRDVADITTADVLTAFQRLERRINATS